MRKLRSRDTGSEGEVMMASNADNEIAHKKALATDGRGGSIHALQSHSEICKAVCMITNAGGHGTGFIAWGGKDLVVLVTVHHVINNMETALASTFTFQYQKEGQGVAVNGVELFAGCSGMDVALCPAIMENGSDGLDYFIAKVNTNSLKDSTGQPLDIIPINLTDTIDIAEGDMVIVIQHPNGGPKGQSISTVVEVKGSVLFYKCETLGGSSGSPVVKEVDNVLKVVAVHRGQYKKAEKGYNGVYYGSFLSSIVHHTKTQELGHMPTLQELKLLEELKLKKPITMQEKDHFFQELLPFLQSINSRWEKFADNLGIEMAKIQSVRADCFARANNEDNSREMLTWWRSSTSKAKRKWCTIKEAAKSLKLNDLVKSLEDAGVNDDNEPSMRDLQMLVIPKITNSWYEFGGKLEIRTTKLDTIKCDDSGGGVKESMKSIINHWLKTNPDACWEDVITALTAMEETGVVDNIKARYSRHLSANK